MPDLTDLARLDEEMAPLRALLDELTRRRNEIVAEIGEQTLAGLDLTDHRARVSEALAKVPAVLDVLDEVLAIETEVSAFVDSVFPSDEWDDAPWQELRGRLGLDDLVAALHVVVERLGESQGEKGLDAGEARAELETILER